MDIGKICRCCLSLNSMPLLSIYDGESGSGCVANMLREIAKLKPQQNDKMPEKVCLSCISEINRCYVFKIKCESSNKTLRQLLPNAVKEDFNPPQQKVSQSDADVQTEEKYLRSVQVQTLEADKAATIHKEVQTYDLSDVFDEGNYENNLDTSLSENLVVCEKVDGTVIKRMLSTNSPSGTQAPSKKKIRFEENVPNLSLVEGEKTDLQETYIVVETINNESNSSDEQEFFVQSVDDHRPDKIITENDSHSSSRLEYYDGIEEEIVESDERKSYNFQENNYIYNDMPSDSPNERDHQIENNLPKEFSDVSPQSLDAPLQQQTSVSKSRRSSSQRKEQHKCSLCIMTFVSLKVLRRHLAKRHSTTHTDIVSEVTAGETPVIVNVSSSPHTVSNDQVELTIENVPNPRLLPRSRTSPKVDEQLYTKFKYYCDYCQAGFAQRKTLAYHMKQNCMTSNFKCNQCERIFVSQENLEAHKDTHNSQHTCLECNKVCSSVEDLSEHMIEEHNRNARNQCHVCKKVFTMKASLMDHLRIHSGERPFLCTVCGKSFRQNSNLRQHLMRHTNEKNFKCDMSNCSNAYVTKAELFSHKRTHTGDHPFKCEICSTCFTSSSSLQKHKRKHTGERPYPCEFCPMRFAALNVLKNHRRTHTGERPYKCEYCDKCFTQKGDCLIHQRTHEFGEVRCFCGSKFSKITNLRQHIKNKHPNMTDEKRRQMNDALNKKYSERGELHITLLEEGEDMDDEGETSHFVTISSIDTSFIKSQHPEVTGGVEDSTEIIMEHIN